MNDMDDINSLFENAQKYIEQRHVPEMKQHTHRLDNNNNIIYNDHKVVIGDDDIDDDEYDGQKNEDYDQLNRLIESSIMDDLQINENVDHTSNMNDNQKIDNDNDYIKKEWSKIEMERQQNLGLFESTQNKRKAPRLVSPDARKAQDEMKIICEACELIFRPELEKDRIKRLQDNVQERKRQVDMEAQMLQLFQQQKGQWDLFVQEQETEWKRRILQPNMFSSTSNITFLYNWCLDMLPNSGDVNSFLSSSDLLIFWSNHISEIRNWTWDPILLNVIHPSTDNIQLIHSTKLLSNTQKAQMICKVLDLFLAQNPLDRLKARDAPSAMQWYFCLLILPFDEFKENTELIDQWFVYQDLFTASLIHLQWRKLFIEICMPRFVSFQPIVQHLDKWWTSMEWYKGPSHPENISLVICLAKYASLPAFQYIWSKLSIQSANQLIQWFGPSNAQGLFLCTASNSDVQLMDHLFTTCGWTIDKLVEKQCFFIYSQTWLHFAFQSTHTSRYLQWLDSKSPNTGHWEKLQKTLDSRQYSFAHVWIDSMVTNDNLTWTDEQCRLFANVWTTIDKIQKSLFPNILQLFYHLTKWTNESTSPPLQNLLLASPSREYQVPAFVSIFAFINIPPNQFIKGLVSTTSNFKKWKPFWKRFWLHGHSNGKYNMHPTQETNHFYLLQTVLCTHIELTLEIIREMTISERIWSVLSIFHLEINTLKNTPTANSTPIISTHSKTIKPTTQSQMTTNDDGENDGKNNQQSPSFWYQRVFQESLLPLLMNNQNRNDLFSEQTQDIDAFWKLFFEFYSTRSTGLPESFESIIDWYDLQLQKYELDHEKVQKRCKRIINFYVEMLSQMLMFSQDPIGICDVGIVYSETLHPFTNMLLCRTKQCILEKRLH
jgi:hypothetical protein